jgi:hypothetical protein
VTGSHELDDDELHVLFEHVWPELHEPQLSVPPQPSEMLPQFLPCPAHVTGVQDTAVQTLLVQV